MEKADWTIGSIVLFSGNLERIKQPFLAPWPCRSLAACARKSRTWPWKEMKHNVTLCCTCVTNLYVWWGWCAWKMIFFDSSWRSWSWFLPYLDGLPCKLFYDVIWRETNTLGRRRNMNIELYVPSWSKLYTQATSVDDFVLFVVFSFVSILTWSEFDIGQWQEFCLDQRDRSIQEPCLSLLRRQIVRSC